MFDFPKSTEEVIASWLREPMWSIPRWAISQRKHDPRKNMRANKACSRRVARLRRKQSKSARATRGLRKPLDPFVKEKVMRRKHQPYRRNDGFWSCSVCKWKFTSKPSADNCPGILRIECANDEYKTAAQWRKLGFEPVDIGDADATSHGHSSKPPRLPFVGRH